MQIGSFRWLVNILLWCSHIYMYVSLDSFLRECSLIDNSRNSDFPSVFVLHSCVKWWVCQLWIGVDWSLLVVFNWKSMVVPLLAHLCCLRVCQAMCCCYMTDLWTLLRLCTMLHELFCWNLIWEMDHLLAQRPLVSIFDLVCYCCFS